MATGRDAVLAEVHQQLSRHGDLFGAGGGAVPQAALLFALRVVDPAARLCSKDELEADVEAALGPQLGTVGAAAFAAAFDDRAVPSNALSLVRAALAHVARVRAAVQRCDEAHGAAAAEMARAEHTARGELEAHRRRDATTADLRARVRLEKRAAARRDEAEALTAGDGDRRLRALRADVAAGKGAQRQVLEDATAAEEALSRAVAVAHTAHEQVSVARQWKDVALREAAAVVVEDLRDVAAAARSSADTMEHRLAAVEAQLAAHAQRILLASHAESAGRHRAALDAAGGDLRWAAEHQPTEAALLLSDPSVVAPAPVVAAQQREALSLAAVAFAALSRGPAAAVAAWAVHTAGGRHSVEEHTAPVDAVAAFLQASSIDVPGGTALTCRDFAATDREAKAALHSGRPLPPRPDGGLSFFAFVRLLHYAAKAALRPAVAASLSPAFALRLFLVGSVVPALHRTTAAAALSPKVAALPVPDAPVPLAVQAALLFDAAALHGGPTDVLHPGPLPLLHAAHDTYRGVAVGALRRPGQGFCGEHCGEGDGALLRPEFGATVAPHPGPCPDAPSADLVAAAQRCSDGREATTAAVAQLLAQASPCGQGFREAVAAWAQALIFGATRAAAAAFDVGPDGAEALWCLRACEPEPRALQAPLPFTVAMAALWQLRAFGERCPALLALTAHGDVALRVEHAVVAVATRGQ